MSPPLLKMATRKAYDNDTQTNCRYFSTTCSKLKETNENIFSNFSRLLTLAKIGNLRLIGCPSQCGLHASGAMGNERNFGGDDTRLFGYPPTSQFFRRQFSPKTMFSPRSVISKLQAHSWNFRPFTMTFAGEKPNLTFSSKFFTKN